MWFRQRRAHALALLLGVALLALFFSPASTRDLRAATASPVTIYGDSLNGWANWSWSGQYNMGATAQKYSGSTSISVTYQSGWAGLYLHANTAQSTTDYTTLRFFVHGGTAGKQRLRVCAASDCSTGTYELTATAGKWQQFDVPLSTFRSPAQLNDLLWQDITGAAQPVFYIDQITLIGASAPAATATATATAVRTSTATAVPPTKTTAPTATVVPPTKTTAPTVTAVAPTKTPAPTATSTPPPAPTSAPSSTTAIYNDALAAGWASWSWGGAYNAGATSPVRSGSKSFSVTYQGGWAGLYLHNDQPVSTQGYTGLRFFIHGGAQGGQKLRFCPNSQCTSNVIDITAQANTWKQVDIALSQLGSPASLGDLVWQESTGAAQTTFYLDDIVLVGGSSTPQPTATPPPAGAGIALSVDAGANQKPISSYIYGMNWPNEALAAELKLPVQRWGGNAVTRYNWQNDTSNRGSDWFFENIPNDNANPSALPAGSSSDRFVEQGRRTGAKTLLQVPIIGWTPKSREITCAFPVSRYGAQQQTDQWRPDCGNGIRQDGSKVTGNDPALTSTAIGPQFVQDWMRHLIGRYGTAAQGGVMFYNLDNEPGLWSSTHRDVHPQGVSYDELRDRSYQYGAAIKAVDPGAQVMGPAEWGWTGYFYSGKDQDPGGSWWNNPQDRNAHGGTPLSAWYLQQMRAYEQQNGKRILDYFDLHYYPQAQGVSLQGAGDAATQARRLRSTRSLWDPTYADESWIGEAVRLIPRMREWVDQNYPGTKLAVGEYNWGALDHINGALAQADVLGIFGREGLDFATLWAPPEANQPGAFAFRMYRNYDGQGGSFGETSVKATSADEEKLAVYAARRSDGATTVIVVNKSGADQTGTVTLAGVSGQTAQVYRYSPANLGAIVRQADQAAAGKLTAGFPKDSITLLVIK